MSPKHDPKSALARFSLEVLSLKGSIMSDNTIATSVLLVNCLMDDMRTSKHNKLNRLMERKREVDVSNNAPSESTNPSKSMIDVVYKMTNDDIYGNLESFEF